MIIITGSAGFVGKALYSDLLTDEVSVIGFDKKIGVDLASDHPLIETMLTSPSPRCLVHLASSLSTPGSIARPEQTFRDTVMTTVTVMTAAASLGTPVILTSSVKARDGRTPYGAAKQMAEIWAMEMARVFDIPLVINRPGTIYGQGQEGSAESGWISWFLKARADGIKVTISGDGTQVRDLLHVDDYVRLLRKQIDDISPKRLETGHVDARRKEFRTYDFRGGANPPTIWDVGGGEKNAVSVLDMADHLGLEYEFGPARYGDSMRYVARSQVPGWAPTTNWVAHPEFYRSQP